MIKEELCKINNNMYHLQATLQVINITLMIEVEAQEWAKKLTTLTDFTLNFEIITANINDEYKLID